MATALTIALTMVLSGCSAAAPPDDAPAADDGRVVLPDSEIAQYLDEVPRDSLASVSMQRLADDLVPPTNRWFSGMVFGDEPQPVFPLPLSFALTDGGFSFGVPSVTTQPGLIAAPAVAHIAVDVGAAQTLVTGFDEVSVATAMLDDSDVELGTVTIARGSPIVGYRAAVEHELELGASFEPADEPGVWRARVVDAEYALVAADGELDGQGRTLRLPEGASATWAVVPEGSSVDDIAPLASSPIVGVDVQYSVDGDEALTTLRYRTADDSPTIIGALPHQRENDVATDCALGEVLTTYGSMTLWGGSELSYSVPVSAGSDVETLSSLDLSGISEAERDELVEVLKLEASTIPDLPADTYFGGKALARIATLLSLAHELQQPGIADDLRERLVGELRTWAELDGCESRADRCFVYDPELRGIVGQVPSFGSDEFNDHHFHYGSFIYAAAVASLTDEGQVDEQLVDEQLVDELRPMISLLAADIASSGGESLPTRRAFDPYSGHSWASGFSPFADGNNQESSSEAVAAHHSLALWGAVAGDAALEEQARWMLALESHSARTYYTQFDTTTQPYDGFDRSVVGIVWDGKRDYGTWFSPEPAAILGIQLLPMRPGTSASLAGDPERILANIDEATAQGPAPQFADYLLMYQALAGSEQAELALEAARDLPLSSIDDGNSRSYLLAFIMAQR
ncbi:glycosyl hydrolase [Microcella sp.]|uniref:glycosyl hydrolase n=1 Tax=Microcella sp. TaxID=1913979 RepID=UPI0025684002|nr:glycosyl hydrolase [Microcella sp.]MBX9471090.1 1,3-beta-glucanase [Microcella sp.]